MRQNLVDIVGQDAGGSLAALSGYLESGAGPDGAAGGLRIDVGLINGGADDVPLLNPFALVQFQVRDPRGFPLPIPTKPPPMFVHAVGGEDWTLDGPVPVVAATRNGEAVDPKSLDGRVFRIAAGDEWRSSYEIRLTAGATNAPAGGDERSADGDGRIAAGSYRVSCVLTLIHAERTEESRVLQSDEVEVRIGRPSP
jgi:hypothetical protein